MSHKSANTSSLRQCLFQAGCLLSTKGRYALIAHRAISLAVVVRRVSSKIVSYGRREVWSCEDSLEAGRRAQISLLSQSMAQHGICSGLAMHSGFRAPCVSGAGGRCGRRAPWPAVPPCAQWSRHQECQASLRRRPLASARRSTSRPGRGRQAELWPSRV